MECGWSPARSHLRTSSGVMWRCTNSRVICWMSRCSSVSVKSTGTRRRWPVRIKGPGQARAAPSPSTESTGPTERRLALSVASVPSVDGQGARRQSTDDTDITDRASVPSVGSVDGRGRSRRRNEARPRCVTDRATQSAKSGRDGGGAPCGNLRSGGGVEAVRLGGRDGLGELLQGDGGDGGDGDGDDDVLDGELPETPGEADEHRAAIAAREYLACAPG